MITIPEYLGTLNEPFRKQKLLSQIRLVAILSLMRWRKVPFTQLDR